MKNILSWIPTTIMLLFFTMISFMCLGEWWNVKIRNEVDKYAWGETNENPWYYHTPELYANVSLIEGLILSFLLILGIKEILNKKTKFSKWFVLYFTFLVLMIISSNIGWS